MMLQVLGCFRSFVTGSKDSEVWLDLSDSLLHLYALVLLSNGWLASRRLSVGFVTHPSLG